MPDVAPGEYQIFACVGAEEGVELDPEFRKTFEDRLVSLRVTPNNSQEVQLKVVASSKQP